ncbi:hypothetical protein ACFL6S_16330 [Candidatus Poribacteria bacterium]
MPESTPHATIGEYIREWLVLGPFSPNDLEQVLYLCQLSMLGHDPIYGRGDVW